MIPCRDILHPGRVEVRMEYLVIDMPYVVEALSYGYALQPMIDATLSRGIVTCLMNHLRSVQEGRDVLARLPDGGVYIGSIRGAHGNLGDYYNLFFNGRARYCDIYSQSTSMFVRYMSPQLTSEILSIKDRIKDVAPEVVPTEDDKLTFNN